MNTCLANGRNNNIVLGGTARRKKHDEKSMLTKSIWMILAATVCLLLSLGTALAADGVTADMTLMDGVID